MASKTDYVRVLHELLPRGLAFPRDDFTSPFGVVIDVIAEECANIDAACDQLFVESDPRTASASFYEWLKDWGVPNACVEAYTDGEISPQTLRNELVFKASKIGGQSIRFFEEMAALFGRIVKISEEYVAGDSTTYHRFLTNCDIETEEREATVEMLVSDPLKTFGDALVECLIRNLKPANSDVDFAYSLNIYNLLADNGNNLVTDADDNIVARVVGV